MIKVTNSLLVTWVDNWVEEQHNNTTILHKSWVLTECLARVQYRAGYCRAGQAGWCDLGVEKQNNYVKQSQVCGNSWEQTYYKGFIFINLQQPLNVSYSLSNYWYKNLSSVRTKVCVATEDLSSYSCHGKWEAAIPVIVSEFHLLRHFKWVSTTMGTWHFKWYAPIPGVMLVP